MIYCFMIADADLHADSLLFHSFPVFPSITTVVAWKVEGKKGHQVGGGLGEEPRTAIIRSKGAFVVFVWRSHRERLLSVASGIFLAQK